MTHQDFSTPGPPSRQDIADSTTSRSYTLLSVALNWPEGVCGMEPLSALGRAARAGRLPEETARDRSSDSGQECVEMRQAHLSHFL